MDPVRQTTPTPVYRTAVASSTPPSAAPAPFQMEMAPGAIRPQPAPAPVPAPVMAGTPLDSPQPQSQIPPVQPRPSEAASTVPPELLRIRHKRHVRFGALGGALAVGLVLIAALSLRGKPAGTPLASQVDHQYGTQQIPLGSIKTGAASNLSSAGTVSINGRLSVNDALVLTPMVQPSNAVTGQLYYDATTNQLSYFNGQNFAIIQSSGSPVVSGIGGLNGNVSLGQGLSALGGAITNAGVLSLQGQSGAVTLVPGKGIGVNGTAITNTGVTALGGHTGDIGLGNGLAAVGGTLVNNGVISVMSGSAALTVTHDDSGNYIITQSGSGASGTVSLGPATPQADASNNPSIFITKQGGGNLLQLATGVTPTNRFVVDQTGAILTGSIGFSQITGLPDFVNSLGGASGSLTLGSGLSISGQQLLNIGVTSLTGTSGQVNVSTASGDVTLSLPQSVATTASPTFAGLALTTALPVTSGGTGASNADSARSNLGAAASGANSDITSLTGLTAITPGSTLTIGSTTQPLILQGSTTTLSSTVGGFISTLGFAAPTANRTITLPDASGTVCLSSGNCLGPAGTEANIELSNLSNVAINTSLLPGTTGIALGSAASPFSTLYLGSGSSSNFQLAGTATAARVITLPDASGTVCLVELGNCTGGANAGANTALSNLASVAINTSLLSGSATINLGSGSNPFDFLYLGGTATNNFQLGGTATAARTITLPDASGTVCLVELGNCAGSGSGITGSGTANTVAVFSGSGSITNSILTQDSGATTVSIAGALSVTGSTSAASFNGLGLTAASTGFTVAGGTTSKTLTVTANASINQDLATTASPTFAGLALSSALPVSSGGTGAASLTQYGVLIGQNTSPVQSLAAGSAGLCLVSTATAPAWQACPGSGGVPSVNGQTGAITIAGASAGSVSAASGTITINDAGYSVKGLASFSSTNFVLSSGAVNTIQDISSSASPSFNSLTLATALQPSNGGTGLNTATPASGQLLIGNGSGYTLATLTAGAGVNIVNTAGAISISAPASGTCANCASQSLSNLAAVAINTSLLPGTTNTIDLGSNTVAYRNEYLAGNLQGNTASFKSSTNSTTAFQVQNSGGTALLTADTVNGQVNIGGNIAASGNAGIGGTLGVTGAASFGSTITVSGDGMFKGSVILGQSYAIGNTGPGGGTIFYIDTTTTPVTYYEAAPGTWDGSTDPTAVWCIGDTNAISPSSTAIGAGRSNTATMLANCTGGAGNLAASYNGGGYSDWFLPSLNELSQLYNERSLVGGFTSIGYWSSYNDPSGFAYTVNFSNGSTATSDRSTGYFVRPIRSFTLSPAVTLTQSGNITTSGTVAAATVQGSTVNATASLQTAGATRIDASGNLTNINNASIGGTLGVSGLLTASGGITAGGLVTANGGIAIAGGQSLVNAGSTLNSALALTNFAANGPLGTAASTVDTHTSFTIPQTTASVTLTLPSPTVATAGRVIYIANIGNVSIAIAGVTLSAGTNASFLWNGTAWASTAVSTGVSLLGSLDGQTATASGASISGNTLYLQSASATAPGLVNTGVQSFSGNKTLLGSTTVQNSSATAFQVQNTGGTNIFSADASNQRITIGSGTLANTNNIVLAPPVSGYGRTFATQVTYSAGSGPMTATTADLNGDGHPDIVVSNWNSGSSTVSVLMNNGNGTFTGPVTYAIGSYPRSITTADLNGDGKPDIIAANSGGNTVSVLMNNGNGTFASQVTYATGSSPYSVTTADVNGDGHTDIIVANFSSNTVSVLMNNGNGTFAGQVTYATGTQPTYVTTADVNGDGKPDIIVTNYGSATVSVLLNNGDGTFAGQVTYATGSGPQSATTADVNGDGKPDIVTSNSGGTTISVLMNNGNGTFAGQVTYATGTQPYSVTTADVNGDGKPDIIVTNYGSATVSVLLNNGDGTFAGQVTYATGTHPYSVTTADVNGDGHTDIIVANSSSNTVSVLMNQLGTYTPTTSAAQPAKLQVLADANQGGVMIQGATGQTGNLLQAQDAGGNSLLALSAAGQLSIGSTPVYSITLPSGSLSLATQVPYTTGSNPQSVATADLNGDGKPDLVVANNSGNTVSVLMNNGNGTFASQVTYATGTGPYFVTTADVNGDGKPDIIVANYSSNTISVLMNNGNGTFASQVTYAISSGSPMSVTTADVNDDGHLDIVTANYTGNTVSVFMNNGNGTFATQVTYATGNRPRSVTTADVNGDGKPDIVAANWGGDTVSVLMNNGDGTFATQVAYATGSSPISVTTADLNGDGRPDIVTANINGNTASVLMNNGNGTFATQVAYATGTNPISVTAADLNGDGHPDVVVANSYNGTGGNTASVLMNNGDGTFATQVAYATGSSPYSVTAADLNGDGKPDIVVANKGGNTVSVLMNTMQTSSTASTAALSVKSGSSTTGGLYIQGSTGQTANLLQLQDASNNPLFTVDASGNTTIAGTTNLSGSLSVSGTATLRGTTTVATTSTAAFQVQNAGGTTLLNADTTNQQISVNGGSTAVGVIFTTQTAPSGSWQSVTYANGMFVAVGNNVVMTSTNGATWTARTAPSGNWQSVTYGNGMFVAVATNFPNYAMTSTDGINWTARTAPSGTWFSVTYGNGMFVAVGQSSSYVMTSTNGTTWTAASGVPTGSWQSVTYANGMFVAVGQASPYVMTSTNGTTWTAATAPSGGWYSITYGNGMFVAVGNTPSYVMTSTNGTTWTAATAPKPSVGVTYGNGMFVTVNGMASTDGTTWSSASGVPSGNWYAITYGKGMFVAVSLSSPYVMTGVPSGGTTALQVSGGAFADTLSLGAGQKPVTAGVNLQVYGNSVLNGNINIQTGSTTALQVQNSGGTALLTADTTNMQLVVNGSAKIQSSTNSTTAFQVQNSSGTSILTVDTSGSTVTVAGTLATTSLTVSSSATFSGNITISGEINANNNVRGINVAVGASATSLTITFGTAYPDATYSVLCTPNFDSDCYVTSKATTGFTLNFGTTAPSDGSGTVDWLVIH